MARAEIQPYLKGRIWH